MNKVAVGAIVIVLAGAASFGTAVYPTMKARHEVEKALASLPAGSEGRYKNLDYSLFSGRLSLSDVELKIVQDGNAYVLRSPAVVIEDASETRLGKLTARDVVIEDPGQVQISALELTGDNLEGLALGDPTPNGKVDRLAMTGVTVSASGQSVKMREVVLSDFAVADKQARSLALGVHGLEMAAKDVPDADAQEMLTQLGYKTLALNFDFAFAHAPEAQRLTIKTIAFGGDEMGRITLTGTFGNVPTLAADDSFAAQAIAAGATLERMEVRYEDSSLTERLLKYAATQQGTDEGSLREQLVAGLTAQGNSTTLSPLGRQALDSALAFLTSPRSLSLKAEPEQPMPLFQLAAQSGDPDTLANVMRLSVSANK